MRKPLLSIFAEQYDPKQMQKPIWLMRQAGRYLPEYMKTRAQAGDFLNLCYNSVLAEEVTLQPVRRYGFDGAILFADILLIPQALGQNLWFEIGEGPRLDPVHGAQTLSYEKFDATLAPIFETLARLKNSLPEQTTLIGFAGAPWTVATYMIAGCGTPDQEPARAFARDHPQSFQEIIDLLIIATTDYLEQQVLAGAEVLQIFESWASALAGAEFERWCLSPVKQIIQNLRARNIRVPIITFPRNCTYSLLDYCQETKTNGVSLGSEVDLAMIFETLPAHIVVQGNLSPSALEAGGEVLVKAVQDILLLTKDRRHIFNLAHGISQYTPPEHVAQLVRLVREDYNG